MIVSLLQMTSGQSGLSDGEEERGELSRRDGVRTERGKRRRREMFGGERERERGDEEDIRLGELNTKSV